MSVFKQVNTTSIFFDLEENPKVGLFVFKSQLTIIWICFGPVKLFMFDSHITYSESAMFWLMTTSRTIFILTNFELEKLTSVLDWHLFKLTMDLV